MLYKGVSELAINWNEKAKLTFQQVAENHSSYKDIANWYLALFYLKKDDKEMATTYLKRITKNDPAYYEKA